MQLSRNTMLPLLGASGLAQAGISFRKKNTLQAKAAALLMRKIGTSSLVLPFHLTPKEARLTRDQRLAAKEHLLLTTARHQSTEGHTWEEIHICVCLLSL